MSTRSFLDVIRENAQEHLEPPRVDELSPDTPGQRMIAHRSGLEWSCQPGTTYKDAEGLAFKSVRRVELVGKFGERTRTDLHYFEIEPGGYSSLEKHLHTHILIGTSGRGVLVFGDRRETLKPMEDGAHIGSLEVHQLRNEMSDPFRFFCIVDHDRDRPMAP